LKLEQGKEYDQEVSSSTRWIGFNDTVKEFRLIWVLFFLHVNNFGPTTS
jgi:hypothetical protein